MRVAAWIASAISSLSSTRNPVRPCSTISGSAPDGKAITGVPQASASMATSELVLGASDRIKRQRAALSRRRLRGMPTGPMNRLVSSSRAVPSRASTRVGNEPTKSRFHPHVLGLRAVGGRRGAGSSARLTEGVACPEIGEGQRVGAHHVVLFHEFSWSREIGRCGLEGP